MPAALPGLRWLLGFVLSTGIGVVAIRRRSLTPGGAAAAVLVGTGVLGMGGWDAGWSTVTFFVSSSLWSRLGRRRKTSLARQWEKGDRRDAYQVAANGGVGLVAAAASAITRWESAKLACAGAIATAAADTWATELGVLADGQPRLITTGAVVPRGTSGAVTVPGTLASIVGAAFVAALFWIGEAPMPVKIARMAQTTVAGTLGSLVDSLLGATIQARFRCPACGEATERRVHTCGSPTLLVGGLPWCTNDVVNVLATACGALAAASLGLAMSGAGRDANCPAQRAPGTSDEHCGAGKGV